MLVNWRTELNWPELKWTDLDWTELNWSGLNWTELDWSELKWTRVNWNGLNWTALKWTDLNWTGLNFTILAMSRHYNGSLYIVVKARLLWEWLSLSSGKRGWVFSWTSAAHDDKVQSCLQLAVARFSSAACLQWFVFHFTILQLKFVSDLTRNLKPVRSSQRTPCVFTKSTGWWCWV